jgi:tetratricopeptide (TPR) repeat protein
LNLDLLLKALPDFAHVFAAFGSGIATPASRLRQALRALDPLQGPAFCYAATWLLALECRRAETFGRKVSPRLVDAVLTRLEAAVPRGQRIASAPWIDALLVEHIPLGAFQRLVRWTTAEDDASSARHPRLLLAAQRLAECGRWESACELALPLAAADADFRVASTLARVLWVQSKPAARRFIRDLEGRVLSCVEPGTPREIFDLTLHLCLERERWIHATPAALRSMAAQAPLTDEAIARVRTLHGVALEPLYCRLAAAWAKRGRVRAACLLLQRTAYGPGAAEGLVELALALVRGFGLEPALKASECSSASHVEITVLSALARELHAQGDTPACEQVLERALEAAGRQPEYSSVTRLCMRHLVRTLAATGRFSRAMEMAMECDKGEHSDALRCIALAYASFGRSSHALRCIERAFRLDTAETHPDCRDHQLVRTAAAFIRTANLPRAFAAAHHIQNPDSKASALACIAHSLAKTHPQEAFRFLARIPRLERRAAEYAVLSGVLHAADNQPLAELAWLRAIEAAAADAEVEPVVERLVVEASDRLQQGDPKSAGSLLSEAVGLCTLVSDSGLQCVLLGRVADTLGKNPAVPGSSSLFLRLLAITAHADTPRGQMHALEFVTDGFREHPDPDLRAQLSQKAGHWYRWVKRRADRYRPSEPWDPPA